MDKCKTKVINMYGGPCSGKSTTAAGLFSKLKILGVNCELVTEFAKDKVWEENFKIFDNQLYVFAKQHHRIHRLLGKVDYVVTDSPLLLSMYYGPSMPDSFRDLVVDIYSKMDNVDIFINRVKAYNPKGRMQNEQEAREIDHKLKNILHMHAMNFKSVDGDEHAVSNILTILNKDLEHANTNAK